MPGCQRDQSAGELAGCPLEKVRHPARLPALPVPPRGADHSEVQRPLLRMRGRKAVSTARAHTNGRQSGSALRNLKAAGQVHGPGVGTIRGGEGRILIHCKERGPAAPSLVALAPPTPLLRSRPEALDVLHWRNRHASGAPAGCAGILRKAEGSPQGSRLAPCKTPPFACASRRWTRQPDTQG